MKCPNCSEDDNEVHQIYSQHNYMMKKNLRTRHCLACGWLFDTEEAPTGEVYRKREGRKIRKRDQGQISIFEEDN